VKSDSVLRGWFSKVVPLAFVVTSTSGMAQDGPDQRNGIDWILIEQDANENVPHWVRPDHVACIAIDPVTGEVLLCPASGSGPEKSRPRFKPPYERAPAQRP